MISGLVMRMMVVSAFAAGSAGCNKTLFPDHVPRSQYERYAELRGQKSPAKEEDPQGPDKPNLRERLSPMGNP